MMPPLYPMPQWLTEKYTNGIMTWILVDVHLGVDVGATYALGGVYVPRWERRNPLRRMRYWMISRKYLLRAWLIRSQKVYRILKFMRLMGYSKPPTPRKRTTLAMLVGWDSGMAGDPLCKLLKYEPNTSRGIWAIGQVLDKPSNDPYEIMDRAANQYPGIMLGLPWANKAIVLIKRLWKPAMWGFWLSLIALAWNGYSEWFR